MSDYTVELRKLVTGGYPVRQALSTYPLYDDTHRTALNNLIVESYWMREIGFETPELFLFRLRNRMNQIMPYYNQVYLSAQDKFSDFLTNVDMVTISKELSEARGDSFTTDTNSTRGTADSKSVSAAYVFPQTLVNEWDSDNPNGEDYKSNESRNQSTSETTGSGETQSATGTNDEGSRTVDSVTKGASGITRAELIGQYRDLIVNVDMLIVSELDSLFMQTWMPHPRLR